MYGAMLLFDEELLHIVSISFTALILTELLMVGLTVRTWHPLMVVAHLLSLGSYGLSLVFMQYFGKKHKFYVETRSNTFIEFLFVYLFNLFIFFK